MDIYSFVDYRLFLKAFFEKLRVTDKSFSMRRFAKSAGIGSSSFLKMVMEGQRNLSHRTIVKIAKALKLDTRQTGFFEAMVLFTQAAVDKERELYFQRLNRLKPRVRFQGVEKHQYDFFKKRHYVVIREMVALPHFRLNYDWIADHISPRITRDEAKEAVEALVKLGLLATDETGKLRQTQPSLTTQPSVTSLDLFQLYLDWNKMARDALLRVPSDLRDFSSLTVPIPKSRLDEIKEKISEFRHEIIDYLNKVEPEFDDVFEMTINLFPVTNTSKK